MKKLVLIVVAGVASFALIRRFGPALRERAMARCQEEMTRSFETHPRTSEIAA